MSPSLTTSALILVSLLIFGAFGDSIEDSKQKPNKELDQRRDKLYENAIILLDKSQRNAKKAYILLEESAQLNHLRAEELVAKAYLFGQHLSLDLSKAYHYFQRIPTNHSSSAHLFLGFLYSNDLSSLVSQRLGFHANQDQAIKHYRLAALLGNPLAKMAIAFRHYYGLGVEKDCGKALELYQSVATDVVEESKTFGGSPLNEQHLWDMNQVSNPNSLLDKDIVDYYKFLAKSGDNKAMVTLGQLYFYGHKDIERDRKRAFGYFEKASKSGNGNALALLAKYYLDGSLSSLPRNHSKALELLGEAIRSDNPIAHIELGHIYIDGKIVKQNLTKAYKHFGRASYMGWIEGIVQIGLMYMNGIGMDRNYRMAFKYLSLAERAKHLVALYNLGQMHSSGTGTVKSCPRAVSYFKSVAERGVWSEGLIEAKDHYNKGFLTEAVIKFAFLSELGYELAQSSTAHILEMNKDQNQLSLALKYWTRSATQGITYSRIKAGDYHFYGLGTAVNYQMSALYYKKASEFRYSAQALFNIGYLHEKGLGVDRNLRLARLYYDFSASIDPNAKVASFLAKIKLNWIEMIGDWHKFDLKKCLITNWDLVLGSVLLVVLFVAIYAKVRAV